MEIKKKDIFKNFIALFILVLLLFTNGCSNQQSATHVKNFSLATTELSEETIKVFELTNSTTIDRKIQEIALYTGDDLATLSNKTIDNIKGIIPEDSKSLTSIKGLNALKSYSIALGDLSSADFKSDIDKASNELYASMNSLEGTYKELTKKDLGIKDEDFALFATLIDSIGTVVVEANRRKAIKEIVIKMDPFVNIICDEISNNIGANKDLVQLNLSTIYTEKIIAYKEDVQNGKLTDLDKKIDRIKELRSYSHNLKQSNTVFEDMKKAVNKVKKGHNILEQSVKQDKFTTPELSKEIGDLVSYSNEMKNYYKGLLNAD